MQLSPLRPIKLGTRPSRLARWQTDHVLHQLTAIYPHTRFQIVTFVTEGDKILDRPLPEIGGKGVFTIELENALLNDEIDMAVHSLKDLPVQDTQGLCIAAVCSRAESRDALISAQGWNLETLPDGAKIGTSSPRRTAQLLAIRPDLQISNLRGNVETRIRKALQGDYDAIILAAAGLFRLGLEANITTLLPHATMLPAPGQGALAVQCRKNDAELINCLALVNDKATEACVLAERTYLKFLGGGCAAPIAAYAEVQGAQIAITGLVASIDGRRVIRVHGVGTDAVLLGKDIAWQALAQGARELLL